jgi:hypothetical protein
MAVTALVAPLRASVVLAPTFEELVDAAREVFVGEVVSHQSQWVNTSEGPTIVTLVTFSILESLKGGLLTQTSLEFLGGTVGDTTLEVSGMPEFRMGDRDVVFVGARNGVSPLVDLAYGRVRIVREVNGVDTVRFHDGRPLLAVASMARPGAAAAGARSMTLQAFRNQVIARISTTGQKR